MKKRTVFHGLAAAALCMSPLPAMAGDAAAGERDWRQCRSCHMIADNDGNVIQRGGRVGPNMYGIIGSPAAAADGFRYSADLRAAGAAGLVWTEENFLAYITDPSGFLRDFTGNAGAQSSMNYQARSGQENILAYLMSLSN